MTTEETKQFIGAEGGSAFLKYVRFEDGTILFSDAADYYAEDHKALAFNHQESKPISAATIKVRHGSFRCQGYSTTLKLGWVEGDNEAIAEALGLTENSDWGYWDN